MDLKKLGIYKRQANAKLTDFPEVLVDRVQKHSTFIHGHTGVGKTHFLAAIVLDALKGRNTLKSFDRGGRYIINSEFPFLVNLSDLLFELRDSYSSFKESEYDMLQKVKHARVLCLDDIGTDKPTDWNIAILYQIINSRYNHGKRTHIASNYTRKELAERYNDRIVSRITEMCVDIQLDGKDRRLDKEK